MNLHICPNICINMPPFGYILWVLTGCVGKYVTFRSTDSTISDKII